ncbi:hypothetical protein BH11PSE11_BH11PSE11_06500 [soil metagenome]
MPAPENAHTMLQKIRKLDVMMRAVSVSFARALLSQLHFRMLLLTLVPFVLSIVIWGLVLTQFLNPIIESIRDYFVAHDGFRMSGSVLATFGLSAIKLVLGPLIAMWLLLPLVVLTTLLFVATIAMPLVVKHVGKRHFATLEVRNGGSLAGSLWRSTIAFLVFVILWIATLPLAAFPPLALIAHLLLLGWFTYRVLVYDALSKHADAREIDAILRIHRRPLLLIGTAAGALGAVPSIVWLGGVWFMFLLPFLALLSIWLYVLTFVFAGLWFVYYCLDALQKYRNADAFPVVVAGPTPEMKDMN